MIGRRLAHYEITAKLGAGGMGEVYRARDTKLGRDVAIKVLPAEMASDPELLSRFRREARAVAALSHPNIVTLHSVEEADGLHFLTMELVAGRALGEITPTGGFPLERFLALATPIADALASAHTRGVVHRDLKPANIMVTDDGDRVKVLDFGLAKLVAPDPADGSSRLLTVTRTREGWIAGTPHYMSPEQARGTAVDHRTDIFSLGVVFYEMLTGKRPFDGASATEVLSSVIKDRPPALSALRPNLPRHLSRVVGRCLEKLPADRYQTARDLYNELKALQREAAESAAGSADPPRNTPRGAAAKEVPAEAPWIAVLPLRTRGGDADLEALADGLTEDIATGLSRFPHLYVVSAGSAARLSRDTSDIRELGRKLGASFLIEGSLRRAGSSVRVGAQLSDAATGTHLWAETFDRDLGASSLFELQDELADRIVATIADTHGVLIRSMAGPVKAKPISELTAHECVIRTLDYQQRLSPEEHAELRSALEGALEREPAHAEAWGWLGFLYDLEEKFGYNPLPDTRKRALAAAQRALELDPASHSGHFALAHTYFTRKDFGACRAAGERLLMLNPRDTFATAVVGLLIACSDDWERGTSLIRGAMALNPHHSGFFNVVLAWDHYRRREYDRALREAEKRSMPGFYKWQCIMAASNGQLGRNDAAREHVEALLALMPDFAEVAGEDLAKEFASEAFVEHFLEGLRKAGLEIET